MRSPLPRAVLIRLETGRLVVLSVLLGVLVGGLCLPLRLALDVLLELAAQVVGYAPPGTPGEGGLLMAFGTAVPWGLLALPLVGAAYVWLVPGEAGDPLTQLVRGYHARGQWPGVGRQLRTLAGTLLGHAAGLLVGRDAPFTLVGQLGTRLLRQATRLDAVETRTLTLAGSAAALGAVLHAPLAAAVLIAEVLYRRFEFEFEVLMPCVLAAVAGYAVYGAAFGFTPLFSVEALQVPALAQLPAFLGVALGVTGVGWASLLACRVIPASWTTGPWRPLLGGAFGLLTAAAALWSTPAVLGDGAGWVQLGLAGFLGPESLGSGAWRWVLLALGARLAFGGGVLPSVGVGGLLGVGLGTLLGTDPAVATLVGAVAFLTVTLNVPVAAALLAVTWGGDALLPAALLTAGLAHLVSGESSLLPGQARSRATSGARVGVPLLPEGVRFVPRRQASPASPLHAPLPDSEGGPVPLTSEQELYRRAVPPSWQGARVSVLALPPGVEVVGLVRDGTVRVPRPETRLTAEDELVFLARPEAYAALEGVLRLPGS
ncbi:chloride channel protein [Deinococcus sp. YIM 77859]|uniref:chloride channel protein n=1 Tax=Deinococcus sp. YIM 77859 TaxID=1540221 RepID=UPI0005570F2C|nr:chloride channel protein [Deinococcus sp. YIM 77859]